MRSAHDITTDWRRIYNQCAIPNMLAMRHIRIAIVADTICAHWTGPAIDRDRIVAACLLHDIGGVLKLRFTTTEDLALLRGETRPASYWQGQKAHALTIAQTPDELRAHYLAEIDVEPAVRELVERARDNNLADIVARNDIEAALCVYALNRVLTSGVRTLEECIADTKRRHAGYYQRTERRGANAEENLWLVQERVQEQCSLALDSITEDTVRAHPLWMELRAP